jgi:hypothetical protein
VRLSSSIIAGHFVSHIFTPIACNGTLPVSRWYNADTDGSCGLTAPGDRVVGLAEIDPSDGSPRPGTLVDAVPVGLNGCGVDGGIVVDRLYNPRPVDGDGDTNAACDIGSVELQGP